MHTSRDDRSLGELFTELSREMTTLMRQEVRLATTEMSQKASKIGKNIGFLVLGGAVAYAGFLALVAAAIIAVAALVPWWLSALVVGLVVAGIGYALVQKGLSTLRQVDLTPQQTVETLKDDAKWAKEQVR